MGLSFEISRIETERLVLRAWRLEDLDPLAAFTGNVALAKYRLGAIDRNATLAFMADMNGDWSLRGYGGLAVARKDDAAGVPIGMSGLCHPADFDEPELFYSLFDGYHGRGYATEMAAGARDWAATARPDLGPLMSMIHPDNAPSRAVSERIGAALEAEVAWRGMPRLRYRHRRGAAA